MAEKTTESTTQASNHALAEAHRVLKYAKLSEKSTEQEALGQYTFVIDPLANKVMVKKAVETIYGITPIRVNVLHTDGKTTRFGRSTGRRSDVKKAIVTLPKGKKIDIHEGV